MNSFIFDIGKTNLKCQLLDSTGTSIWSVSRANTPVTPAKSSPVPYTYFDIDDIWQWLLESLREAAATYSVDTINISTHGACVVLLTETGDLALPVLDYEDAIVEALNDDYATVKPDFAKTLSPNLPAGLNVGRQLRWLQKNFPVHFSQTVSLLFYPQYWAWRLSGVRSVERTSLGCHTDLWQPTTDSYSPLLGELELRHVMPPLVDNRKPLGTITTKVAEATGLSHDCVVYPGVHDSNASLACHLWNTQTDDQLGDNFTVVSSGTWIITMAMGASLGSLSEEKDMLANVNAMSQPVACGRFMGGREFETICQRTNAQVTDEINASDLQQVIDSNTFALPNFAGNSGPFNSRAAEIITTDATNFSGKALATLYIALMIDLELELLGAEGSVVFGSTSLKNPLICQLLAQLRPQQTILLSQQQAGTIQGCWALTQWHNKLSDATSDSNYSQAAAANLNGLETYQERWRQRVNA